jgi:hypothetical protein
MGGGSVCGGLQGDRARGKGSAQGKARHGAAGTRAGVEERGTQGQGRRGTGGATHVSRRTAGGGALVEGRVHRAGAARQQRGARHVAAEGRANAA